MKKSFDNLQPQGHNSQQPGKSFFEERRVRQGKTRKDHASGAHKRNAENKSLRDAYVQNRSANAVFPSGTSRGNGNSSKRRKYYG